MRLLLVEDSTRLQRHISQGLRDAGYAVDVAASGTQGLWMAKAVDYDVIILDLMLPGIGGLDLLRELRDLGRDTHVLVVTAKDTLEDRVAGLNAGADDYLVKPFAFEELLARVQALVRRRHNTKNPVMSIGDLRIDVGARSVTRGGQRVDLTPREFALLECLAIHAGEVVSRTEIETRIYDELAEPMSNVVDAAIYALRKKIDVPDEPSMIETRRGMGYILRRNGDGGGHGNGGNDDGNGGAKDRQVV
jgi:DNA-binding response OmpR family regulator